MLQCQPRARPILLHTTKASRKPQVLVGAQIKTDKIAWKQDERLIPEVMARGGDDTESTPEAGGMGAFHLSTISARSIPSTGYTPWVLGTICRTLKSISDLH